MAIRSLASTPAPSRPAPSAKAPAPTQAPHKASMGHDALLIGGGIAAGVVIAGAVAAVALEKALAPFSNLPI